MAEFGENLKKIREERGLTQQTLADHLYVTRQAVSRWEGGSRYPDLMTAKKMSRFLEVSLDELLSDDDMKLYVEKSAILDNPMSKRAQIMMVSLAFMCSLVVSLIYICNRLIQDGVAFESNSEMIKNILLTIVLGYGIYAAITDKLTPKVSTLVSVCYMGTAVLTGIFGGVWMETGFTRIYLVGATVLSLVFLVICICFFHSKKTVSPMPLYFVAGIYAVLGIVNMLSGMGVEIPIEIYRDIVMLHFFALLQNLLLLGLLVFMACTLDKKRKLAAR